MKKSLLLVAAATATLTLASCGSIAGITTTSEEHYTESRELEVATPSQFTPIKGHVQVNPVRIKKELKFTAHDVVMMGGDIEKIKARASFMVLDEYNADELVSPLYDIHSNDDGSYTVTVIGYTGKLVFENK